VGLLATAGITEEVRHGLMSLWFDLSSAYCAREMLSQTLQSLIATA
jgi:hypothetical protein